jgi:hypothetical protein
MLLGLMGCQVFPVVVDPDQADSALYTTLLTVQASSPKSGI